jgi:hypothetical protein
MQFLFIGEKKTNTFTTRKGILETWALPMTVTRTVVVASVQAQTYLCPYMRRSTYILVSVVIRSC